MRLIISSLFRLNNVIVSGFDTLLFINEIKWYGML
jgi:hypothetical protein